MNIKMICFDMDGTIADLYGVENWLYDLEHEIARPYKEASPMWDMRELARVLTTLNIEIRVITWVSKKASSDYYNEIRKAKLEWLKEQGFPFDHFHCTKYGATKADSVRKYLADDETAILIDDNAKIRKGWTLGDAIDPTEIDLIEYFKRMAG